MSNDIDYDIFLACVELINRATYFMDHHHADDFAELFTPDGFFLPPAEYPDGQAMLSVHHRWQGRFSEMQLGRALDTGCPGGVTIPARVSGPIVNNPTTPAYIFADNFSS